MTNEEILKEFRQKIADLDDIHVDLDKSQPFKGTIYFDGIEIEAFILKVAARSRQEGVREGRAEIIKKVDDTIAEFGDQGIAAVSSILDEWFHFQGEEVEY